MLFNLGKVMAVDLASKIKSLLLKKIDYKYSASLCILLISVALLVGEYLVHYNTFIKYRDYDYIAFTSLATLVLLRALIKGIDRWFLLFFLAMTYVILQDFRSTANHVFFTLLLLFPIAVFPNKESTDTYSDYVRRCLGVVMIAAATQKLISGNYLNGEFLKYLTMGNEPTKAPLALMCFDQPVVDCDVLVYLSIFTVIWQYAIGILLLINCRHILAFFAELLFILGVGFATDEMNFQTVNIAALIIAFRISAPVIAFVGLAMLIIIDLIGIQNILGAF